MKEYDFYIVPTPIGNLGDITNRAIEVLNNVDIIACEDIRVTQKLLNHFSISTKCISYHKFNEKERVESILNLLKDGKKVALVSDAGTPLFCDPGAILVKALKDNGIKVTALPGANAVATFLSQIPRETEEYVFVGFLPKSKKQILTIVNKYKDTNIVFYESPNRLIQTLEIISQNSPDTIVSIGRELTKVFEEITTAKACDTISHYQNNILKGEIVGLIHASQKSEDIEKYYDKIKTLLNKGFSAKDICVILSTLYNLNKNELYNYILNIEK